MRASHMVIDLNKFNNNINKIKKYVGNKTLIPVIKANGYGTYINTRLDVIDKFDIDLKLMNDEYILDDNIYLVEFDT